MGFGSLRSILLLSLTFIPLSADLPVRLRAAGRTGLVGDRAALHGNAEPVAVRPRPRSRRRDPASLAVRHRGRMPRGVAAAWSAVGRGQAPANGGAHRCCHERGCRLADPPPCSVPTHSSAAPQAAAAELEGGESRDRRGLPCHAIPCSGADPELARSDRARPPVVSARSAQQFVHPRGSREKRRATRWPREDEAQYG